MDYENLTYIITLAILPIQLSTHYSHSGTKWVDIPIKFDNRPCTIRFIEKQVIPNLRNTKIMYFKKTKFYLIDDETDRLLLKWQPFHEFVPELKQMGLVISEESHEYKKGMKAFKQNKIGLKIDSEPTQIAAQKEISCPSADKLFQKLGI